MLQANYLFKILIKEIRICRGNRLMKLNDDNKPHSTCAEPHLTGGAETKPGNMKRPGWNYSNSHFTGRFIADTMTLLKDLPRNEISYC